MNNRIRYLLLRAREAGARALLVKIAQKLRPYIFRPIYYLNGVPVTGPSERLALNAFGEICRGAFNYAAAADPVRADRIAARCAEAASGTISVLGYGRVAQPSGAGWHADPLHGYAWPRAYFANVDFLAADIRTDVKVPWEMSRLQWLVWLAEASVGAPREEYARLREAALGVIFDWADANPPGFGVNWTCGMEVAIRSSNIAIVAGVFAKGLDDVTTDRLCSLLRAHQLFLARFPEVSDVPGNHYLTDIMGEVVLHAALDGLNSSATSQAFARFFEEAERQFEPGGCHLERATIYHRLTMDVVALVYALAQRIGDSSARTLKSVMDRAASFVAQIADDSGLLPVFGDQDSGFVLWFGEAAQQADARLCGVPVAPLTDLYSFFAGLAGNAAKFFPKITREDGARSGFATMSGYGFRVTLKTGPIGLKGRAAHDHDDALSVAVSYGTHALLIDQGCHSYTLDPAIRQNTIVSSRHNAPTPLIRERHVPTMGSISASVRGAPTAVLRMRNSTNLVGELASTPTSRMSLTRFLRIENGALEIADNWCFDTQEGARLLWLLAPGWVIEGPESAAIPSKGLLLRFHHGAISLTARVLASEGAWFTRHIDRFSPDYGAWADCPALLLTTPNGGKGHARLILSS